MTSTIPQGTLKSMEEPAQLCTCDSTAWEPAIGPKGSGTVMFFLPLCCLCIFEDSSKPEEKSHLPPLCSSSAGQHVPCSVLLHHANVALWCSPDNWWPRLVLEPQSCHETHGHCSFRRLSGESRRLRVPGLLGAGSDRWTHHALWYRRTWLQWAQPLLAIVLTCQLILHKDLEVKGEPSPQWKLPYQNLALSVMVNVYQIAPGFQKDLVQKLGAFLSHKMHSLGQKYQAKEDKTVGLEGVEDSYKKLCKALFFLIPHWSMRRWKASGWLAELHSVLLKYVKWSGANPCLLSYDSETSRSPVGKTTSTCSKSVLPNQVYSFPPSAGDQSRSTERFFRGGA